MTVHRPITRRVAISDMGKAGLAVMVFGVAACSSDAGTSSSTDSTALRAPTTAPPQPSTSTPAPAPTATTTGEVATGAEFHRVELGGVSAYILYRDGEAALVDTGNPGSEAAIEAGLDAIGLDWGSVGHIIVTHRHSDHMGSLGGVAAAAPSAEIYAGLGDMPAMLSVAQPTPVGNNGRVFDLDIIETSGHTPGHISVLDRAAGVLVAGDALFNRNGELTGSLPQYTDNATLASASVKILAQFEYDVVLFGHGDPLLSGGSDEVKRLAAGVP